MITQDGLKNALVAHITSIGRTTLKMSYIFLRKN